MKFTRVDLSACGTRRRIAQRMKWKETLPSHFIFNSNYVDFLSVFQDSFELCSRFSDDVICILMGGNLLYCITLRCQEFA